MHGKTVHLRATAGSRRVRMSSGSAMYAMCYSVKRKLDPVTRRRADASRDHGARQLLVKPLCPKTLFLLISLCCLRVLCVYVVSFSHKSVNHRDTENKEAAQRKFPEDVVVSWYYLT